MGVGFRGLKIGMLAVAAAAAIFLVLARHSSPFNAPEKRAGKPVFLVLSAGVGEQIAPFVDDKTRGLYPVLPTGPLSLPESMEQARNHDRAWVVTDLPASGLPALPRPERFFSLWPAAGVASVVDPSRQMAALAEKIGKPSSIAVSAGQGNVANAAAAALRQGMSALAGGTGLPWRVEVVAIDTPWPAPAKDKVHVRLSFAAKPKPSRHKNQVLVPLLDPKLGECPTAGRYLRTAQPDLAGLAFLAAIEREGKPGEYLVGCR